MNASNFDRLKELLADEKYAEAVELLPSINEKHAKTSSDFIALAKAYGKKGDFQHAEKMFKKAYRLRPSKLMYHDVMDVCLDTGHISDAEDYLREYAQLPTHDEYSYAIYNYKILKKKNADRDTVIGALEKINEAEYSEKWAYELAKQYYKAGLEEKCKAECEKIIRAFEYSAVAAKARILLAYYNGEVTAEDIKSRVPSSVRRIGGEVRAAEQAAHPEEERKTDPASVEMETAVFTEPSPDDLASEIMEAGASYGIEDIARGVRDIISGENGEPAIEEIVAEHSDPEIEEIVAEHSDPEIEEIVAEHSDPEIEEITADHFSSVKVENEEDGEPRFGDEWFEPKDENVENGGTVSTPAPKQDDPIETSVIPQKVEEEIDDEKDITKLKISKSVLEDGFMRQLNTRRFERSMPQYVLYAPKMNFSKSEIKEGKLRSMILENSVDIEGICKNYFRIDDLRRAIIKSLELAVNEKGALCFVVTGEPQTGKSTLALTMIHLMFEIGILDFEKTAKIKGEKLNKIDLSEKAGSLRDCNILIENAGELSGSALTSLVELFGHKRTGGCLILEDSMKNINDLFRTSEQYNGKFNNRIHLPKYSTDELMGFAYDVFTDADYAIEASAADNFKKLINKKTPGNTPKLPVVLELAKNAVANADERLTPEILKMAAEATIENYNLVILNTDIKP